MEKALAAFVRAVSKIIGRRNFERLLIYSAKAIDVNLHLHGLVQIGGLSSQNPRFNGENYFIKVTLCELFKESNKPVFFDVGANVGNYALELRRHFPNAEIFSFEPVKSTFDALSKNTYESNIKLYNIGFSDKAGKGELYNTVDGSNTEIASIYKEVIEEVFQNDNGVASIEFQMDTIDNFCASKNIENIDFLKMDVEGHELAVLKGAVSLLLTDSIKVIQFEFNLHNIYAHVFLRDFYVVLHNFEFYRLSQNGFVALGGYSTFNEIFILQNIVAIRKDICHLIKTKTLNFLY
jgi:FkbM family methyltransferase